MIKKELYRPNVAMIIVSNAYPSSRDIFLAQRNDLLDVWQFPQGGIDDGEEIYEALFRELKEEIGTDKVEVIAEFPEWISYDFPPKIAQSMKPFIGQRQRYFLVKLNEDAVINIQTDEPEFRDYKFVSVDEVLSLSASFKKSVYECVITYFKKEGLL
ncbi:NUDIX hydrolase [Sulfurimonas denitrificans DSM 1251]|jgi:putative (di)nucleoside polyphosphate hydrolase|uniref:NUDIX hydrolase n=1 Tax=Sulfurimonas denitrificans (strain ATCC 33889 / DSM 1251) TaxID=326298 RepID=Q30Q03_SULDN|nr:RNA pyrophosphohydrolase [Sulfurimonas denitrificans]ABB44928.1 NUDIX hydrolase [Sulfurimonas denitrificans DSM 1251]MDD3442670.1 RNA pyrophosphohydrolase [Sulfurimonas denitrificans]